MAPIMVPSPARIPLRGYVIYPEDLEEWMAAGPPGVPAWYSTDPHRHSQGDTKNVERLLRRDVREFHIWDISVLMTGRWRRSRCVVHVETRDPFRIQELTHDLVSRSNVILAPYECRLSKTPRSSPNHGLKDTGQKIVVGVAVALVVGAILALLGLIFT